MAGLVAKSYSDAIFSLAQEEKGLDEYKEQLCFIGQLLKENPDFDRILNHPKIHKDEKKDVIDQVFSKSLNHTIINFMKLLVDKNRFQKMDEISKEFVKSYNKEKNIEVAWVRSAKVLEQDEVARIQAMLENKLHKHVEMRLQVDASLIAGIRIKIGDQVLDNTAINRMERLRVLAQKSDSEQSRGECR